jgi:NAD(P)H dehydrogenase (quinone)
MKKVAIIYHSGYGHTEVVARAVLKGASSNQNVQAEIFKAEEFTKENIDKLNDFDAMIFGSPTYMGSVSAKMKQFMEDSSGTWYKRDWKNKIAAGFTNSGSMSGDKLNSLVQFAVFAAQHAMIWVGVEDLGGNNSTKGSNEDINRIGSYLGLMTPSNTDQGPDQAPIASDLKTAEHFGARIAQITTQFNK